MKNRHLPSAISASASLPVFELAKYAEGWLLSGEIAQHSPATLANRRLYVKNLLWFLRQREYAECGVMELRQFFHYLTTGHNEPGGRWGKPDENTPVKPGTIATYHRHIKVLFRWLIMEGILEASPMDRIPTPVDRPDEIQPFTDQEVSALLSAAKRSNQGRRDEAILLFLLDTGVRASELCALRRKDLDMTARRVTVQGKGGKSRPVYFGKTSAKALWNYLNREGREEHEALFQSQRGEAMTPNGLLQLIERLGVKAKIMAARCSPHTFRHTFAISFLRNGGNQFSLMTLLGHTDIAMTSRYVKLAQADVERQHRQFSPADHFKKGKRN